MHTRKELHAWLQSIGIGNVYFQPPESVRMEYPAIVYSRSRLNSRTADDSVYMKSKRYTITVIDHKPDSAFSDRIADNVHVSFDRSYIADNLYHDVFTITLN